MVVVIIVGNANIASAGIELRAESYRAAYTSAGTIDKMRDSIATRVALRINGEI